MDPVLTMSPEVVNQNIADIEQAEELQRQQQLLALAHIALRFQVSNPELAKNILGVGVVNYYRPQLEEASTAAAAWHVEHQQTEARLFHEAKDDKEDALV